MACLIAAIALIGGCNDVPGQADQQSPQHNDAATNTVDVTTAVTSPAATAQQTSDSPSSTLTGFGATVDAWESIRGDSVPPFNEGSVYGAEVRPGVYEYFGVVADPLVTFYSRGFPDATDLEAAKQFVLTDFPADASIVAEDVGETSCVIVLIESATVAAMTDRGAQVGFFSPDDGGGVFDPSDVSDAVVFSSFTGPSDDLGRC